jgi:hypothetical protein
MARRGELRRPGGGVELLPCGITILRDAKNLVERQLVGLADRSTTSDPMKLHIAARCADPS